MANSKALSLSLDLKTATLLLREVDSLRRKLDSLREKVLLAVPAKEGSKLWWERETIVGLKQFEEGKYYEAEDLKEALRHLHS